MSSYFSFLNYYKDLEYAPKNISWSKHNFLRRQGEIFPWAGKNESGVSPKNKGGVPILLGAPPLSIFSQTSIRIQVSVLLHTKLQRLAFYFDAIDALKFCT